LTVTNEAKRNEDTVEPLVRLSVDILAEKGPMKCCDLAHMLGLPNGRRLSMLLQWREGKHHDVTCERGKWMVKPNIKNHGRDSAQGGQNER
jgi:hypothetical protein